MEHRVKDEGTEDLRDEETDESRQYAVGRKENSRN